MKINALLLAFATAVACTTAVDPAFLVPSFPTGRIVNGQDAIPHSAPYIVSLTRADKSHLCGGTIIAKEWVLTAAHCISNPIGMAVTAGLHKRTELTEAVQQRVVDFGRNHELYVTKGVGPHDIAILHVSEPFEFTRYVQPASLPAFRAIPSGNATLYGWGQSNAFIPTSPKTLQTVQTQLVDYETCKATLPEKAPIDETNICSDSFGAGISACSGDSGGPLVQEIDGAPSEVIGVVSWGYLPCGVANMPSIYARVSAYTDWIIKIMNAYYILF